LIHSFSSIFCPNKTYYFFISFICVNFCYITFSLKWLFFPWISYFVISSFMQKTIFHNTSNNIDVLKLYRFHTWTLLLSVIGLENMYCFLNIDKKDLNLTFGQLMFYVGYWLFVFSVEKMLLWIIHFKDIILWA
jgi:hypothetical protein